ncbi:hypothetical protein HBO32_16195 [Pseudomonas nitroreducens]|uniref:spermine/spermidine synthase domain-containing protein n=1 Tax=Pseudomonas nitroreducens TaxID=46680 RepID=UPI00147483A4|nr:hypothetical protein [Pseudomonas nitroreducens]NMZ74651.1 hypothetical protein [Pseudomonas nitroreducens]
MSKSGSIVFVWLSFLIGFLSLGEEIVWVRVVSFNFHSVPQSFSFVLFFFILGISLGAWFSKRVIVWGAPDLDKVGGLLISSSLMLFLVPMLMFKRNDWPLWTLLIGLLIAAGAFFKGAIFPLLHHYFSVLGKSLGVTLSRVYSANVMGSAMGPLFVGFVLIEYVSMYSALCIFALLGLVLGFLCLTSLKVWRVALVLAVIPLAIVVYPWSSKVLGELLRQDYEPIAEVGNIIENRHGVVYTVSDGLSPDRVFGGNVYDGAFNVDVSHNVNGIERVYLLSSLTRLPKRVAVIGLSSGAWLKVISAFPGVEKIDVVEINDGYIELTKRYSGFSDYLSDSRVSLSVEDGRQWLERKVEQGQQYDLIVMNTTWHWRAYSGALLSKEFMGVILSALSSEGVAAFNSTGSADVFYTASRVFPYAYKYSNFVYVGKTDLRRKRRSFISSFCEIDFQRLGVSGCDSPSVIRVIKEYSEKSLLGWDEFEASTNMDRPAEVVTDDNMITEYKYGRGILQ